MSVYGLYNFITASNPYDAYIAKAFNSVSYFQNYAETLNGRFRINSFVSHPIYYGYLSGIFCLIACYSFFFIPELFAISLFSIPLTFLNLILSNSRTPLIAFCLSAFVFIMFGLNARQKLATITLMVFVGIGMLNTDFVQERIASVVDIFKSSGGNTVGSSADMRATQLNASYKEFLKHPIFGNGFNYINENLGWAEGPDKRILTDEFQGFESYIYQLLIEQGSVGILINLIFFLALLKYFCSLRFLLKEEAALGISLVMMFITFICGTGALNSWVVTMGTLGILLKYCELSLE
jgi:hypothetical protein